MGTELTDGPGVGRRRTFPRLQEGYGGPGETGNGHHPTHCHTSTPLSFVVSEVGVRDVNLGYKGQLPETPTTRSWPPPTTLQPVELGDGSNRRGFVRRDRSDLYHLVPVTVLDSTSF